MARVSSDGFSVVLSETSDSGDSTASSDSLVLSSFWISTGSSVFFFLLFLSFLDFLSESFLLGSLTFSSFCDLSFCFLSFDFLEGFFFLSAFLSFVSVSFFSSDCSEISVDSETETS